MVAACRAKGLTAFVADFLALPTVITTAVDAAFAMNCLLHVPPADLPNALTAIHNVLSSDGLFFLGQYGGIEYDDVRKTDKYEPKRYFSLLADDAICRLVEPQFSVLDFAIIDVPGEEPGFHFQALTLRRR